MPRIVSIAAVLAAVLLLGCGGSGSGFSVDAWRGINPGDSEDEVVAALGEPANTQLMQQGGAREVWSYCEESTYLAYQVWFDTGADTVRETDTLTRAEAGSQWPC